MSNLKRMTQFYLTQCVLYHCIAGINQTCCHELDLQPGFYIIQKKASNIDTALALPAKTKLFALYQKD